MLRTRIAVSFAAAAGGFAVLTPWSGVETAQRVVAPAAAGGTGGGQAANNGQVGNAAPASNESKLVVADVADVGQVITDQNGMTLYRYDKDTAKPPKSNCDGDCAKIWPPVLANGQKLIGIDPALVGDVTRADGAHQITLAGWPLYYYIGDKMPGTWKGQNVGGIWWVVTPEGKKNKTCVPKNPSPAPKAPTGANSKHASSSKKTTNSESDTSGSSY